MGWAADGDGLRSHPGAVVPVVAGVVLVLLVLVAAAAVGGFGGLSDGAVDVHLAAGTSAGAAVVVGRDDAELEGAQAGEEREVLGEEELAVPVRILRKKSLTNMGNQQSLLLY